MTRPAIVCKGVTRRFGDFTAVDSVDLEILPGRVFGFVGSNGSGKTTLIRMLCGLLALSEGRAEVGGTDVSQGAEKILTRIGYMSQKVALYQGLTVTQNLDFYAGIYLLSGDEYHQWRRYLEDRLDLSDYLKRPVGSLPAGVRQRTALMACIMHRPEILFLDEPTAGVDLPNRVIFWEIVRELASKDITVFATSHYMDEMELCDDLAFIAWGKLIAKGTPEGLKTELAGGYPLKLQHADGSTVSDSELEECLSDNGFDAAIKDGHIITQNRAELTALLRKAANRGCEASLELPGMEAVFSHHYHKALAVRDNGGAA